MPWIDDYVCTNSDCSRRDITIEFFLKSREEVPVCETCEQPLVKAVTVLKKHGSWGQWRALD